MSSLTTLKAAKTWIGLDTDDTSQDDLLTMLVEGVSAEIEGHCNRKFAKADYSMEFQGRGQKLVMLAEYPVASLLVVQVMSDERAGVTGWTLDKESGILEAKSSWSGHLYQADYTAGYVLPGEATEENPRTLPKDLEKACWQLIEIAYSKRGNEHLATESLGPIREEYLQGMPLQIEEVLEKYKKPVLA